MKLAGRSQLPPDPHGRRWRDRATGDEFRAIDGAPLLSGAEACRGAECFFVKHNRIYVMRRASFPVELHGPSGGNLLAGADAVESRPRAEDL